jgi:DNA topoisomerase-1
VPKKGKLFPTDLGLVVTDFFKRAFRIMDYSFTANERKEFDAIADGKMVWNKMVQAIGIFLFIPVLNILWRLQKEQRRILGTDEVAGKPIEVLVIDRFGPMVRDWCANRR